MDGLEWKRSKYSKIVQRYLRYAEKLAVKYSDKCIADSPAIQDYLRDKYKIDSRFIPYGASIDDNETIECLHDYEVSPYNYCLLILRFLL